MRPILTNVEFANATMRDAGIDAVIAYSPSNVRYLTGYWCWLAPLFREFMVQPGGSGAVVQRSYCLQPLEGDPCLVVELHSVHCERMFAVTEDGARPLVPQDRSKPVVGTARGTAR